MFGERTRLIWVTKLDGDPLLLNDDQIIWVEVVHDTIISLENGEKLRVLESAEELTRRIAIWRQRTAGLSLPGLTELEGAE